jgi:hypothetical protein
VGGVLYLLRDADGSAIIESFGLHAGALARLDQLVLPGHAVQLAASSAGLAAVTVHASDIEATWIDLPMTSIGAMQVHDVARVPGGLPVRPDHGARVSAADDGSEVLLITCATPACASTDRAELRAIDFSRGVARVGAPLVVAERGGFPVTHFVDDKLFVASSSMPAREATQVRIVHIDSRGPRLTGIVEVSGTVTSLAVRDATLVAFGRKGSAEDGVRLSFHDVDIRRLDAPRLRGSVTFGSD